MTTACLRSLLILLALAAPASAQTLLFPSAADHPTTVNGSLVAIGANNFVRLGLNADIDGDSSTNDSSAATLTLPDGARVRFALLYWQQTLLSSPADLPPTPTFPIDGDATKASVKFRTPDGQYQSVGADKVFVIDNTPGDFTAHERIAYADVTTLVGAHADGGGVHNFGVADIRYGNWDNTWTLFVVYELDGAPIRSVRLWHLADWIFGNQGRPSTTVTLGGILAPSTVTGDLVTMATNGQSRTLDGTETLLVAGSSLTNAANPVGNVWNNSNSIFGVDAVGVNPLLPTRDSGLDLDVWDIDGVVPGGATSVDITISSTAADYVFLHAVGMAIDVNAPDFVVTKSVAPVGTAVPVPGGALAYTVVVTNAKNDTANDVVLVDAIPAGTVYMADSLRVDGTLISEEPGDDEGELSPDGRTLTVRLGAGADATDGGSMTVGTTTTVTFSVQLVPSPPAIITNQAVVTYTGDLLGADTVFTRTSGTAAVPGAPTTIVVPTAIGCADGTREGFTDATTYPTIASCGGAWDVPGAFHDEPACDREAGNDGNNSVGAGCNVEDICAIGWHVCYGPDDIDKRTDGAGCVDAVAADYPSNGTGTITATTPPGGAFFMTRTSGSGTGNCDEVVNGFPSSFNDIFGCGNMGSQPASNCAPLNQFGNNQCIGLDSDATAFGYLPNERAWFCDDKDKGYNEAKVVTKSRAGDQGGVICCKDTDASLAEICDGVDNDGNGLTDETNFDDNVSDWEFPGEPCDNDGEQGTIACTSNGGWTCAPLPVEACCFPDGECEDLQPGVCTANDGSPAGVETSCEEQSLCMPLYASVSGRVWHDVDLAGDDDSAEPGLAGVTVMLSSQEGNATAVTTGSGAYTFTDIPANSYNITVTDEQSILSDGGFEPTILGGDSHPSPVAITLTWGDVIDDVDFGFIGGCVSTTANGTACNDQSNCTTGDVCDAGACVGDPVVCTASDQCHGVGTCNESNGTCSDPPLENGVACNDGDNCTTGDACTSGTCGGAPVVCEPSDQCHVAGTCNPADGTCSDPPANDGVSCDDRDLCTVDDRCTGGRCGGSTVTCPATGPCRTDGVCDPQTGSCEPGFRENGVSCDDGNACSDIAACVTGVCVAQRFISCDDDNDCTADRCDPEEGCIGEAIQNGSECDDRNLCTGNDRCEDGVCEGNQIACKATPDACHLAGACNPATGSCDYPMAPGNHPVPLGLTDLGTLGGASSVARAINAEGGVVGAADTEGSARHAVAWPDAAPGAFDLTPDADDAIATGINDSDVVAGALSSEANGTGAFVWYQGQLTQLWDVEGGVDADGHIFGPNPSGEVAGNGVDEGGDARGYYASLGGQILEVTAVGGGADVVVTGLGASGGVIGQVTVDGERHAFLWRSTAGMVAFTADGGTASEARDINAANAVVGSFDASGETHAFFRSEAGTWTDLGTVCAESGAPCGDHSEAVAVNDGGMVLGVGTTPDGARRAFRWTSGGGLQVLDTLAGGGDVTPVALAMDGSATGAAVTAWGATHAVRWSADGSIRDLGTVGQPASAAVAIHADGFVSGHLELAGSQTRPFLWSDAQGAVDLGTVGGATATMHAMNRAGRVVGVSTNAAGAPRAFVSGEPRTSCVACEVDADPPQLICPTFSGSVSCSPHGNTIDLGRPSVSDACDGQPQVSLEAPAFYPIGATDVTFTAIDAAGNVSTCTTTVTVRDDEAPMIFCPDDLQVIAPRGLCGAHVDTTPAAVDNCDPDQTVTIAGPAPDAFYPVGTSMVTHVAVDSSGNRSSCTIPVTVKEADGPTLTCPAELTVDAPEHLCAFNESIHALLVSACFDDLDVASRNDAFPVGETTVHFEADAGGDANLTCETLLTVRDVTAPRVICPPYAQNPGVPPAALQARATDACGVEITIGDLGCSFVAEDGSTTTLSAEDCGVSAGDDGRIDLGALRPGQTAVSWTVNATDPSGNEANVPCSADLDRFGDRDDDGVYDRFDNCPDTYNPDQSDIDFDGIGDVCDDIPHTGLVATGGGGCASGGAAGGLAGWLALLLLAGLFVRARRRRRA